MFCRPNSKAGWQEGNMCPHPFWPLEMDGMLVPPGKAYSQLTDHLITRLPLKWSEAVQEKWFSQNINTCKLQFYLLLLYFEAHFACQRDICSF